MITFQPAQLGTAKLKMAFMGFQGSGKTYTASSIAIGLVQTMQQFKLAAGGKPIAFIDTERSSRWILPRVQEAGLHMQVVHSRAFADLVPLIDQAERNNSVLIIDSLTHHWTEFTETYAAKKAAEYNLATYRLQFQDWAYLKARWRTFTDRFVNSDLSIIACGRAGFEYDMERDEETGKKQLEKTGIKFKAEGEMGYEPDLLVLMERIMDMKTKTDQHVAKVIKDRSALLDGKEFIDPTFTDFKPHIDCLNLGTAGAAAISIDTTRTSAGVIPAEAPRDRRAQDRAIVIDEINDLLLRHGASGTAKEAQIKRSDLLAQHFGTVSKTAIEERLSLFDLRAGYDSLHQELEGKPSRYGAPLQPQAATVTQTQGANGEGALIEVNGAPHSLNSAAVPTLFDVEAAKDAAKRRMDAAIDSLPDGC